MLIVVLSGPPSSVSAAGPQGLQALQQVTVSPMASGWRSQHGMRAERRKRCGAWAMETDCVQVE